MHGIDDITFTAWGNQLDATKSVIGRLTEHGALVASDDAEAELDPVLREFDAQSDAFTEQLSLAAGDLGEAGQAAVVGAAGDLEVAAMLAQMLPDDDAAAAVAGGAAGDEHWAPLRPEDYAAALGIDAVSLDDEKALEEVDASMKAVVKKAMGTMASVGSSIVSGGLIDQVAGQIPAATTLAAKVEEVRETLSRIRAWIAKRVKSAIEKLTKFIGSEMLEKAKKWLEELRDSKAVEVVGGLLGMGSANDAWRDAAESGTDVRALVPDVETSQGHREKHLTWASTIAALAAIAMKAFASIPATAPIAVALYAAIVAAVVWAPWQHIRTVEGLV